MEKTSKHPDWSTKHRKPGTELKLIRGKYYLYGVKSVYDKKTKKSRKISLGIIGRITQKNGLIPSDKRALEKKSEFSINTSELFSFEYGYSKEKFNDKVSSMGTLSIIHNTNQNAKEIYFEYKNREEIEQFFDHFKNTIDASSSNMQREASLNGWMFINHLSMLVIYRIYEILKNTPLNKKQTLNHKYSINNVIMHLQSINKILIKN